MINFWQGENREGRVTLGSAVTMLSKHQAGYNPTFE